MPSVGVSPSRTSETDRQFWRHTNGYSEAVSPHRQLGENVRAERCEQHHQGDGDANEEEEQHVPPLIVAFPVRIAVRVVERRPAPALDARTGLGSSRCDAPGLSVSSPPFAAGG
jgi:hypothetical protein